MAGKVGTGNASATLGHDKHKVAVLKAIADLRQQNPKDNNITHSTNHFFQPSLEDDDDTNGTGPGTRTEVMLLEQTRVTEDDVLPITTVHGILPPSRIFVCPPTPQNEFDGFDGMIPIQESSNVQPSLQNDTSTPNIPQYPAVPKLQSVVATVSRTEAATLSSPRQTLPKSTLTKLSTTSRHKTPAHLHKTSYLDSKSSGEERNATTTEYDTITSSREIPRQEPCSRTNTISSVSSVHTHQGPCPIYISPSTQLQCMQGTGELDHEQELRIHTPIPLTRSQASSLFESHTSTQVPSSCRKDHSLHKALLDLTNVTERPNVKPSDRICTRDWAQSSEWVAPSGDGEDPTQWIEDFLVRKEEADHLEEEEKRRKERERRPGALMNRVSTIGKTSLNRRRLSRKSTTQRSGSFEARQESTRSRWGERAEDKELSWAHELPPSDDEAVSARQRSKSPPHKLQRSSPPKNTTRTQNNPPDTARPVQILPRTRFNCARDSRFSKFTFRSVSNIRSDVKRSFSTSIVPAFNGGRNSMKELVNKFGKLGGSLRGLARKGAVKKTNGRRDGEGN